MLNFEDICIMSPRTAKAPAIPFFLLALSLLLAACGPRIGEKQSGYIVAEDGSKIYFEKTGAGKKAVVLMPGPCSAIAIWDSIVPFLTEEYSILRFDPPGYGKSEEGSAEVTPSAMARLLFRVMDARGIRRAALAGYASADYSMLAARAADSARIAGIISVNGFSGLLSAAEKNGVDAMDCRRDHAARKSHNAYRNVAAAILRTLHMPLQLISSRPDEPLIAHSDSLFPAGLLFYPLVCDDPAPLLRCPFHFQRELRIALASLPF